MKQRSWLITGGSSGLGKSLALCAIKAGDTVYATFRSSEQAQYFEAQYPGRAIGLVVDLGMPEQVASLIQKLGKEGIVPDILVNNAGMGFVGAIEETTQEEALHLFQVNFFAMHALTRALLPGMRARKSGQIVQLSSHSGVHAFPGFGMYSASKFAMEGLSEALKAELAPHGIDVILVEPGPFRTQFASQLPEAEMRLPDYEETSGAFRDKLKSVSGKQEGDPEKAAKLIYQTLSTDKRPFRLILGPTALKTVTLKQEALEAALKASQAHASEVIY
ncbi:Short-chain dehydrogenase [Robiginitalea myxolifaciens]|uniref:Short-chain dehydrogenase n=1 Tax=Robiginitalea myxolifaciens TaxID=400055 RepID=A0A1I6H7M4_9FLAO|nr:SDR family NAD(P)-dependent oxidoreductase [Robiginitalea myxolifaciens]SFR50307.1 Short-chain dehydrogenase [Robiginitalea myxolifaciens]